MVIMVLLCAPRVIYLCIVQLEVCETPSSAQHFPAWVLWMMGKWNSYKHSKNYTESEKSLGDFYLNGFCLHNWCLCLGNILQNYCFILSEKNKNNFKDSSAVVIKVTESHYLRKCGPCGCERQHTQRQEGVECEDMEAPYITDSFSLQFICISRAAYYISFEEVTNCWLCKQCFDTELSPVHFSV